MRITERYHRGDFGHMELDMTFDDPKYYTRPFTLKLNLRLIPDTDILEFAARTRRIRRTSQNDAPGKARKDAGV